MQLFTEKYNNLTIESRKYIQDKIDAGEAPKEFHKFAEGYFYWEGESIRNINSYNTQYLVELADKILNYAV